MPNHPPRAGIPEVIFLILTNPIREYHDRYIEMKPTLLQLSNMLRIIPSEPDW